MQGLLVGSRTHAQAREGPSALLRAGELATNILGQGLTVAIVVWESVLREKMGSAAACKRF